MMISHQYITIWYIPDGASTIIEGPNKTPSHTGKAEQTSGVEAKEEPNIPKNNPVVTAANHQPNNGKQPRVEASKQPTIQQPPNLQQPQEAQQPVYQPPAMPPRKPTQQFQQHPGQPPQQPPQQPMPHPHQTGQQCQRRKQEQGKGATSTAQQVEQQGIQRPPPSEHVGASPILGQAAATAQYQDTVDPHNQKNDALAKAQQTEVQRLHLASQQHIARLHQQQ
eukprot:16441533-Heterocapsa_arctica.AAC.1